jgi:nitroimidazol reductase NimA-like FMN-containing flavoprotein (pyridoxamine 5'-phosphate oxidase superfamily)
MPQFLMPAPEAPSARTQVKRLPARGVYDRAAIHSILDATFICHIGFQAPAGHPVVIPTAFGRDGERVFVHGSAASHMLRSLREGIEMCLTATLVDGLVLARSVFHHSINYRSVMVYGRAAAVTEPDAKLHALEVVSNHIAPGRGAATRRPSPQELKATLVLELPLTEASAKVRSGPPGDEEADYALPIWAGVVPITTVYGQPEPDPRLTPGIPQPVPLLGNRTK